MTQTEERLRAALAARAAQVTYPMLRRAEPPRGRTWGARRVRAVAYAVVGAAAVLAVFLLVLLPGSLLDRSPVPPAHPPRVVEPPLPAPTPVLPGPAPALTHRP